MVDEAGSMEADLDRKIEAIIGKMVKGTDTIEDRKLYLDLCRKRASLMRSTPFMRSERLRLKRRAALARVG